MPENGRRRRGHEVIGNTIAGQWTKQEVKEGTDAMDDGWDEEKKQRILKYKSNYGKERKESRKEEKAPNT